MFHLGRCATLDCDSERADCGSPDGLRARRRRALPCLRFSPLWAACVLVLLFGRVGEAATLTLEWDPPADGVIAGYVIRYGARSGTYTNQIDVGSTTRFSVNGLNAGRGYYFTVVAYDSARSLSAPSGEVFGIAPRSGGTPPPEIPPPELPTAPIMSASVRDNRFIDLSWTADAGADIIGYRISAGTGPKREDVGIFTAGVTTRFTIGDLPAGIYHVRVQPITVAGAGASSHEVFLNLESGGPAPDAPRSLDAIVSRDTVALSWLPPADGLGGDRYVIEVGSAPGGADVASFETQQLFFAIQNLPHGPSHLRVRAVRVDVGRSASNEVVAFIQADGNRPLILPGAPVGIARRTSPTRVALTWSPPVTGDAPDFYIVEVTDRNGDPVATLETGSAATFLYYSLPSVIHVVRVRAANAAGIGPAAPPLTIVMPR